MTDYEKYEKGFQARMAGAPKPKNVHEAQGWEAADEHQNLKSLCGI